MDGMTNGALLTPESPIHIISLGAGVQSSVMALMGTKGELTPKPKAAVCADTMWERLHTYLWMQWLFGCKLQTLPDGRTCAVPGIYQEGVLDFPVHVVNNGDLRAEQINARVRGRASDGHRWASLPYFTKADGSVKEGKVKRQCTSEYKIDPCEEWMKRTILGLVPRKRLPKTPVIVQWRGITVDEASRLKDSREPWYSVRYPLALELNLSRHDCEVWLWKNYRRRAPRSACLGCPFHDNVEWRDIKSNPIEWADAVAFDKAIRKAGGMRGDTFLHRTCVPLDEVDLSTDEDRGQLNMFENECEGFCGV